MVLKKIDNRIRDVIENAVATRHRSVFLVVGERARDQVVILHHILSKAQVKSRPSVLWCYKKELGFTSHRQKRMKKLKRKMRAGQLDPNENEDPFEMFIATTEIRYCYYAETNKILGNTFGMCVLQDFESLSPNILARTVETVEGGGIVVVLLNEGLESLQQLSARVTKEQDEEGPSDSRFNKRFLLSLSDCKNCVVLDDQLNVLPLFGHNVSIEKIKNNEKVKADPNLIELRTSLSGTQPASALANECLTYDQAKSTLRCIDVLADPPQNQASSVVVSMTAGRGRGKSATLGLSISAAIALGYSNILVTSPSVENVKTLFDFVQKGLTVLNYERHIDFDVTSGNIVQSQSDNSNKAVVKINVHRDRRRQNITYMTPDEALKQFGGSGKTASNAAFDLVLIDEAAAIPLPKVRQLLEGSQLCFLASTISGYEGTGRSLSLKLIQQLRQSGSADKKLGTTSMKRLHEVELIEPIRYGDNDPVEKWLTKLLCLDVTEIDIEPDSKSSCPPPDQCELFYVNRDALFSYHKAAEKFLHRIWSLYVAAHYKNSPNDMQLLADAPSHHIFVLLAPVPEGKASAELPDVLCVIQVCLEGNVSKDVVMNSLARGRRPAGDLVPWTLSQQYQDTNFATSLSGARIVRIATNPDYSRMGYGSRAIKQLAQYFGGNIYISGNDDEAIIDEGKMPPLLSRLSERKPEGPINYLSVSYGLGTDGVLFRFWRKLGFVPLYLRQTASDVTGEHSCVMLKPLDEEKPKWLQLYSQDFLRRLLSLLSLSFAQHFPPFLALDMIESVQAMCPPNRDSSLEYCQMLLLPHDLKRLNAYAQNQVDHHLVSDLLPHMAWLYFMGKTDESMSPLSRIQSAILIGCGLQRQTVDVVANALSPPPPATSLPTTQILALLTRIVRKLVGAFEVTLESNFTKKKANGVSNKEDEEADEGDDEVDQDRDEETSKELKPAAEQNVDLKGLEQYTIRGTEEEWAEATAVGAASMLKDGKASGLGLITVKTKSPGGSKRKLDGTLGASGGGGGGGKKKHGGKNNKNKRK